MSTPGLSLRTRGLNEDRTFLARTDGRPPNTQLLQRVTVNSTSLEVGTSEALL